MASLHLSPSTPTLLFPQKQPRHGLYCHSTRILHYRALSIVVRSSLLASPPTSKEEAVKQAKMRLTSTLTRHLTGPRFSGKIKKLRQPKFQIEIPLIDDTPSSISNLGHDLLDLSLKKKDTIAKALILWPTAELSVAASNIFPNGSVVINGITDSVTHETLRAADFVVFIVPEASDLVKIRVICDKITPKPAVILNPNWEFGDITELGEFKSFAESFDVIYAFNGLSVQGILTTRKGILFNSGEDEEEKWAILVEENGEMKTVSKFKSRPSKNEVSDVLYNATAANSPFTKSAKFLKHLLDRKE